METNKELLEQINHSIGKFSKETKEQMNSFMNLMQVVEKKASLDEKQKELIALACSITAHCKWCVAFHVNNAIKAGAKRQEILESAWVAVLMGGGPALMYAQLVLEALDEFKCTE